MRNVYIAVVLFFVASIVLFAASMVYLDSQKHKVYSYTVNLEGRDVGSVKIEKFFTEDKKIYKSLSTIPLYPVLQHSKSRLTLDKKYVLESYVKESFGSGAEANLCLEKRRDGLSFVSTYESQFACLDKIPVKENAYVFEEVSPVTYLPIIENYDFKRGRSQSFNAVINSSAFLPPMKRFVTLTSIRDEYLKIDEKTIKTECIIVKIKKHPPATLWVAKSDKSLVALEIPQKRLKISRTALAKNISSEDLSLKAAGYSAKEAAFKNGDVELSGTLSAPLQDGRVPAVLLISGDGPQDRDEEGLFAYLADSLSANGFCVLRFDKRGIGSSGGDFSSTADSDVMGDLRSALAFLEGRKEVDPERIALIGHSRGVFYAAMLAAERESVKAIVMMAPQIFQPIEVDPSFKSLEKEAGRLNWSDYYLKLAKKAVLNSISKVKNTTRDWITVSRKRCYAKRMRERLSQKPLEAVKNIRVPALILQGKEDDPVYTDSASMIDAAMTESQGASHTLAYFGYLGHYFGKQANDGMHKLYYRTDPDVLETVKNWLRKALAEPKEGNASVAGG